MPLAREREAPTAQPSRQKSVGPRSRSELLTACATTLIPAPTPSRNLSSSRSAQGLRSRGVSIVRGRIQVGPPGVTRTSGPRLATSAPVRLGGPMIRFNAVGMPFKILCGAALVPHQTIQTNADTCRPAPLSHFHPRAGNRVRVGVLSWRQSNQRCIGACARATSNDFPASRRSCFFNTGRGSMQLTDPTTQPPTPASSLQRR